MIAIIDYGLGNLSSIKNMFKRVGERDVIITSDAELISRADKVVLPGVGAFDNGMKHLSDYGLIDVLNKKALVEKVPFLGICLGMQLMTKSSEEGELPGLGWFNAKTLKFKPNKDLKIPHMGWNFVELKNNSIELLGNSSRNRFYFVHSYYVHCEKEENVLMTTQHGVSFHSAIIQDNLIGMQFHPEKSLHFGMSIFANFSKL